MAPELLREIHFAKQRRTIAAFCRRLTAEEWLGCFREHGDFDRLPGRIFRRWVLLRKSILLGENRIDHKLPVIAELEDPAADLEAGLDAVHKELHRLCDLPFLPELQKRLAAVPFPHRITNFAPLAVQLGELTVFTGTLLGFLEKGQLYFLTFAAAPDADTLEVSGVMERYFALHSLKILPERVSSLILNCDNGEIIAPEQDFYRTGQVLQRIGESAAEIREALCSGSAALCRRQEHCDSCRFREICRKDHE